MASGGFVCAGCQREVSENRWERLGGRDGHMPPLCHSCEREYTPAMIGLGSFKDRRKARQVLALSNFLSWAAHRMQWEARHGRS